MKTKITNSCPLPGDCTFEASVSDMDNAILTKAVHDQLGIGADYTPLAVSCQIVNGINYCFLCKKKIGTGPDRLVLVYIYYHAAPGVAPIIRLDKVVLLKPTNTLFKGENL